MPPIVWLAIVFGAGIVAGPSVSPVVAVLATAVVVAVLPRHAFLVLALGLMAGSGLGLGRWSAAQSHRSCQTILPRGRHALELVMLDRVRRPGDVVSARAVGPACHGEIRVRWMADADVEGGERFAVAGFWTRSLRVIRAQRIGRDRDRRGRMRGWIEGRYEGLFGERSGMAAAVTLARPGGVAPEDRETFVRSGLAHLLAISGLHVGFLGWWAAWLAARLGLPARRAGSLSVAVVMAYIWLLGFPAPATRAACFLAIGQAARVRQRKVHPAGVIAVSAIAVLSIDPTAATSVGAWLSLGAVLGISWARSAVAGPSAVRVAIGATLFTSPITALVFGTVAPIGLIANLVAVPLAGLAVPGVLLALAASLIIPALADVFAAGAGAALSLLEMTARVGARVPFGHAIAEPGWRAAWPWLLLAVMMVRATWGHPTRGIVARRIAAPAAAATWAWAASAVWPGNHGQLLELHFLAVGQGDATAIRTPRGHWVVIDGGPAGLRGDQGRRVVVPYLRRRGARRVTAAFLSHGDADHVGGLPAVLEAFTPEHVWEPGQPVGERGYIDFLDAVERTGARWRAARRGDTLVVDSVYFVVHHPDSAWLAQSLDRNENSLLIEVTYGAFRAIFPGDGGVPMERHHPRGLGEVDVLKVGHHGSATATGVAWLEHLEPAVAVISAGIDNRFGHPRPEVLERLRERAIAVYRTDRHGTIRIRSDGRTYDTRYTTAQE